ncbi:MAG TPA: hypothetical protein PK264_14330 [Hyphomicrobiaceae bacterium]|nr:hypothetical protein [Hyphomicrobiaceae bacterium]
MKMTPTAYAFNAIGALVAIGTLAVIVRSTLMPATEAPCGERYAEGVLFAFEGASGAPFTTEDFEARLAGDDWGIKENFRVVPAKGLEHKHAMRIALPKGSLDPAEKSALRGGVAFRWEPRTMTPKAAACLGYRVRLPADFDFAGGGRLPGLMGGERQDSAAVPEKARAFTARPMWRAAGVVELNLETPEGLDYGPARVSMPKGQWVQIEQEIVLNTPGKRDGILRLWVDGRLASERRNVAFRAHASHLVTGVAAEVTSAARGLLNAPPKEQAIEISPFELRWGPIEGN